MVNGSVFVIFGILLYLIIRGSIIIVTYKRKMQVNWLQEGIRFLFALYMCLVVSVTLFPFPVGFTSSIEAVLNSINLIPLKAVMNDISQIGIAYDGDVPFMIELIVRNVGGNILLLMPLGFLAPILWRRYTFFKKMIVFGLVVSVSIECLQFIESFAGGWGRVTDIDDVIFNVLGVAIGFFIYKIFAQMLNKFNINILQKWNVAS